MPPNTTCAVIGPTPDGFPFSLDPVPIFIDAHPACSLHAGQTPVVNKRSRFAPPARPIASTSRGSPPGEPPHTHAPPFDAHAQWPHRRREDLVSSLPPAADTPPAAKHGSGSSGRKPPAVSLEMGAPRPPGVAPIAPRRPPNGLTNARALCEPPPRGAMCGTRVVGHLSTSTSENHD